ncbi:MAG: ABC transporter substrate-binding protein [Dehalococcoidales bacterium]|nr:ABC transporter substrate-binding protein [Dehalococcoidales bacterium]
MLSTMILAGCGGSDTTTTTTKPAATTQAASKPAATTQAATKPAEPTQPATKPSEPTKPATKPAATTPTTPKTEKKYGGILRISTGRDARTPGDPVNETSHEGMIMMGAAVEYLARLDGTETCQPWLAETWELGPDAKSLTVKLKKGIKFHDGTDFNAEAVKWNWERYMEVSNPFTASVESIDIIDDYTLRANLSVTDISIIENLLFDAGAIVSPTAWQKNGAELAEKTPVGTGPFEFVSWEPEVSMTFKKFDGYWRKGEPYLDGVEFTVISDEMTKMLALQAGDVDVAAMLALDKAKQLADEGKYGIPVVTVGKGLMMFGVNFDTGNPDSRFTLKVRQAVAHAIDRQAIVDSFLYGFGAATDQWGSPESWVYNTTLAGYPYDPARAKALLAEEGYADKPMEMKYHVTNMDLDRYQAIQGMLNEAGFKCELVVHELPGWRDIITSTGWHDETVLFIGPGGGDMATNMAWFRSDSWAYVSWKHSPEIDAMVDKALGAPDLKTLKESIWAIQKWAFQDELMYVPAFITGTVSALAPSVKDSGIFENVSNQWRPNDCWLDR